MTGRIAGVVLAGGRGSRMGVEPKVLLRLDGTSLVERALRRAARQVDLLLLSSNLSPAELGHPACPVLADSLPGFRGPLAGIATAMEFLLASHTDVGWLCSFAADTPWFPRDLASRLAHARDTADKAAIAVATSGGRRHPVFALWPVTVLPLLKETLASGSDLGVGGFQSRFGLTCADWPVGDFDPFFNLNTRAEYEVAAGRCIGFGDSPEHIG